MAVTWEEGLASLSPILWRRCTQLAKQELLLPQKPGCCSQQSFLFQSGMHPAADKRACRKFIHDADDAKFGFHDWHILPACLELLLPQKSPCQARCQNFGIHYGSNLFSVGLKIVFLLGPAISDTSRSLICFSLLIQVF